MVFFTALLVVILLYYLQTDGLIYITVIAVAGELINIFMSQTMSKAAEKKAGLKYSKIVNKYKDKVAAQKRTIKELEDIQEDSVQKVYAANKKIKEYEEKLGMTDDEKETSTPAPEKNKPAPANAPSKDKPTKESQEEFIDLPAGSNRKTIPIKKE